MLDTAGWWLFQRKKKKKKRRLLTCSGSLGWWRALAWQNWGSSCFPGSSCQSGRGQTGGAGWSPTPGSPPTLPHADSQQSPALSLSSQSESRKVNAVSMVAAITLPGLDLYLASGLFRQSSVNLSGLEKCRDCTVCEWNIGLHHVEKRFCGLNTELLAEEYIHITCQGQQHLLLLYEFSLNHYTDCSIS